MIRKSRIICTFFDEGTENVESYRTILQDFLISELQQLQLLDRTIFQQEGTPYHLASNEQQLWNILPDKWIGKAGPICLNVDRNGLLPLGSCYNQCTLIDTKFFG